MEVKEAKIGFEHRSTRFRLNIATTRTTARLSTYGAYNAIQINFNGHVPPAWWVGRASPACVGVLPSGSPSGIPRRVVAGRDSPRSERDGARNTRI